MNRNFSSILAAPLLAVSPLALALTLTLTLTLVSCSQPKYVSDYDYRKAREAYEAEDYDEALSLLDKQLRATPKHVDALYLRALIHGENEAYAAAQADLDRALKYYRGGSEAFRSGIMGLKGLLYQSEERFAEAARAFGRAAKWARKDDPEHVPSIFFLQAQSYYKNGDPAAAEKVYLRMLKDDPQDPAALVGLARNRKDDGQFEAALDYLDKAQAVDETYSSVYKFQMQVLDSLGRTDESIDAALKFFEYDENPPFQAVAQYGLKHLSYAEARILSQANQSDDPQGWLYLLTDLYELAGEWASAVKTYDRLEQEYDEDATVYHYRAKAYEELGDFRAAMADLQRLYDTTGDDAALRRLGDVCRSAGLYDEAVRNYKTCLERDPSSGYLYYAIGWSYELSGDPEQAMRYYDRGIDIDKSYAYLFLQRGDLRKLNGRTEEAWEDYEQVLALDTVPEDGSCRQYALLGLGREEDAVAWMDRILASDTTNAGSWYDKACLYGRMERVGEAIAALDTAFQKGFRRFAHLEHDDDMDPIRDLRAYQALVEKYRALAQHPEDEATPDPARELAVGQESESRLSDTLRTDALLSEVPMRRKKSGTYEVPCTINGLPLKFIFDTGASDVTLSSVEADFMLKNDYLSEKDFRGSRKYLTASGSICDGALVCLKEVRVGDVTLKNVEASVVRNQQAPLLLGQSALERLGCIIIDNESSRLIIKRKE